jgi:hypothetical protein
MRLIPALLITALTLIAPALARGESKASAIKDDFNALFVTAGYSTLLGAALGTATLAFTPHPKENTRYIGLGAAGGFIFGTLLGTYFVFSPPKSRALRSQGGKDRDDDDLEGFSRIKLYPVLDLAEGRVKSWHADWVIARF